MSFYRYASDSDGAVVRGNYDSDGAWVGEGPDPRKGTSVRPALDLPYTPVIEEIVLLASKHTGLGAVCVPSPDLTKVTIYYTTSPGTNMDLFWDELNRLTQLITKPLDEPVMEEDEKVIGSYWYVIDGKPAECEHFNSDANTGITVAEFKRRYGKQEVRRCDMYGRLKRFPAVKELQTPGGLGGIALAGPTVRQNKRRPRSSNKIKKVQ